MLNLLIISKDIDKARKILNYISENSNQIRIYSIVNSLDEGLEILNNGIIDVTLINTDDKINTIYTYLSNISDSYIEKYKKTMIILSNNISHIHSNHYICECFSSEVDMSILFLKINKIVKNKLPQITQLTLSNKINKELEFIGYNLSYNGTKYLSESIALIYNNYYSSENLSKNIYPVIAKKHNKTVNTIKCNIISATNSMYYKCNEIKLKQYFNLCTTTKPKPKLVIHTVLNKLYDFI